VGPRDSEMTKTIDPLVHVLKHASATGVSIDQHHIRPSSISISNTSQSIPPLPGGPGEWDVSVPFDAKVAMLILRSNWQTNDFGGKGGGHWIATRTAYLDASGFSHGGPTFWQSGGYFGFNTKPGTSLELSARIFTSSGAYISLTDAYLAQTGPSSRVLRMSFTNYGASYYTLYAVGEVQILG